MKTLEITLWPPSKKSGGGLVVYQSMKSILSFSDVDYIGPDFEKSLFENKVQNNIILQQNKNIFQRVIDILFRGITSSYYRAWKEILKDIDWISYDFVHIESSRFAFLVSSVIDNGKVPFIRIHNIESDYVYNLYRINKNLIDWIVAKKVAKNERNIIDNRSKYIFLTNNDYMAASRRFGIDKEKSIVIPVCIESDYRETNIESTGISETINVLITGSLSYGPNEKGTIWFLKEVWSKNFDLIDDISLTIAGSNPTPELVNEVKSFSNIKLIISPDDMKPYFDAADVYIAPIFSGAGMKVKVAESLSNGVPVIGTSHAFIGYESVSTGIYHADTSDEFIGKLNQNLHKLELQQREKIRQVFKESLSMERSSKQYLDFFISK